LFKITVCLLILTPFLIEHSRSKDKFLRASLRRIFEAQNFEVELKREDSMNKMLLAWNQELVAQLDA
jgi:hypothetical protein